MASNEAVIRNWENVHYNSVGFSSSTIISPQNSNEMNMQRQATIESYTTTMLSSSTLFGSPIKTQGNSIPRVRTNPNNVTGPAVSPIIIKSDNEELGLMEMDEGEKN